MSRSLSDLDFFETMEGIDLSSRLEITPEAPLELSANIVPINFQLDLQRLQIVNVSSSIRPHNHGESNYYIIDPEIVVALANTMMSYSKGFVPIRDNSAITLGRGFTQRQFLHTDYVSTAHAVVIRRGDKFKIKDLGSTNGTYFLG